ncbi:MAG TPA: alanine--tRNA ligase, partial [Hyphomicrobium sp.]
FMQYEQLERPAEGGQKQYERIDLPKHSVDTGMGLERIAAVLQGTHDNYEIDLFKALIAASVAATGVPAKGEHKASHRVIADHLRASSFLIADGVLPSNEGRGYVLRRIMRRAMRHAHLLGATEPLMHRLVPALIHEMGDTYHELQRAQPLITETLHLEETRFKKTLAKGLGLLAEATGKLKRDDVLSGDVAFKLYDTYGFPLDLTEDALRSRGIVVDTDAFNAAMERQRDEARKAWKGSGEAATEAIWFQLKEKLGATEFLGYDAEMAAGEISALVKGGKEAKSLKAGEEAAVIVNQTPFYGESGGQVGDQGVIHGAKGALFRVTDTQKKAGGLFVHLGRLEKGTFKLGETVDLEVDHKRRSATRANHSATHLLHEALRQVLGPHVAQKGSLVAPDRLRFDFSHTKPMTAEEIAEVEARANAIVLQNAAVETRLMALEDALESGAMALFGEKYGDEVRVVSMGEDPGAGPGDRSNKRWSVELCGGTHVARTGDIGLVKIVAEQASASGVRRIEALTADAARAYLGEQEARLKEAAAALHVRPEDVVGRVEALLEERKQLERQLAEAKKQIALGGGGAAPGGAPSAGAAIKTVGKVKLIARTVQGLNPKDLRGLIDDGKKQVGSGIV